MAGKLTPIKVPRVVLLSWKKDPVDCSIFPRVNKITKLQNKNGNLRKKKEAIFKGFENFWVMGTSVSRSEDETEDVVGEEGGGSMSSAGSNISKFFSACLSLCLMTPI